MKKSLCIFLSMVLVISLVSISAPVSVQAEDGTSFNGPHNAPCTIEAEDFNNGGSQIAYYANTAGNQGNCTAYRTNGDVDIYDDGVNKYISSSIDYTEAKEYVKYTFSVSSAGWFKIDYSAKTSNSKQRSFITLIDERALGLSIIPKTQAGFGTIGGPQAVYLSPGTHVLKLAIGSGNTCINSITVSGITAPSFPSPQIASSPLTSDEVVVADAIVTNSPFNADNTGVNDSTGAIQNAIDTVYKMGGGTVFIPAGIYRVDGTFTLKDNITLRGDWKSPLSGGSGTGTILKAASGLDNENGTPFINIYGSNVCVRNLGIWYPDQHYSSSTIHAYPWTIYGPDGYFMPSVLNVTLYNSYNGIKLEGTSGVDIENVYMTALKKGIHLMNGWETAEMCSVRIENSIWKNAPANVITNAPATNNNRALLDDYTTETLTGIQFGQVDGYQVYDVSVKDALKDILIQKETTEDHIFYGVFSKINGNIEGTDIGTSYWWPYPRYINTDNVAEAAGSGYTFAGNRKPASTTNFYNVKNSPYNAKGDGATNDTAAIQNALNAAYNAGGGTVYLPGGYYKIDTHLTIPSGVELRGTYGAMHTSERMDSCVLLAYEGKDTTTPEADTAFITLNANSGARGFSVYYPEQGYGSAALPVRNYPYCIRGNGSGVWVKDVNLANACFGVDLGTNRCDNFLLNGLWGTVFKKGVYVSSGTSGGVLEKTFFTYGILYQTFRNNSPFTYGRQTLTDYTYDNTQTYLFGNCTGINSYSAATYGVYRGFQFLYDKNGHCTNSYFWQPADDIAKDCNYRFESGNNINFIGMVSCGSGTEYLRATPTFTGTVNIFGRMVWGANGIRKTVQGGTVNIYNERTLTYSRAAAASAEVPGQEGSKAVDAAEWSKWAAAVVGTWLYVDLGQPSEITYWGLKNAECGGDPDYYNSKVFRVEATTDNSSYDLLDGTSSNTDYYYRNNIPAANYKAARLTVYHGTQTGYDDYTRIFEFELFGRPGWHFTSGTDQWTTLSQISNFAAANGRLGFTCTGGDPQILSRDNLGVNCTDFKKVKVKFKNKTASTAAQLFFITNGDQTYSEAKSKVVATNANDSVYTEYTFDFSDNSAWTGTLKQLRFDPANVSGDVRIDSIVFVN